MAAVEETIQVTIEQDVVPAPATEVSPATEKTDGEVAGDGGKVTKKTKEAKPKKVSVKKVRSAPAHPPYIEMITEAVTTLKEKNGSSQQAIQKFIEENHKNLPSNFRKLLLGNLRKLVASGKLVRIKNSFKLPAARSSPKPAVVKAKPAVVKAKKAAVKPKKAVAGAVKPKKAVTAAAKPKKAGKTRTVAAAAAVTAKAKAKAKAKTAKPKPAAKATVTAAAAKPKVAGTKRKAAEVVVKPKEKAAKVAKTATKSTPSKKAAPVAKVAKIAKAAAPKSVKPKSVKSVKSPAKRAMPRRGRK